MRLKITPTLLNSFDWLGKAPSTINKETGRPWDEEAYESILNMLHKEWRTSQAMHHGLDFENAVQRFEERRRRGDAQNAKLSDLFVEFCGHFEGMLFQQWIDTSLKVDGDDFYISGRVDAIQKKGSNPRIIDIKTSTKYKDSYLDTWQHSIYMLATGISEFAYLLAILAYDDDKSYEDNKGKAKLTAYHIINTPVPNNRQELVEKVETGIRNFMIWVNQHPDMQDAYYNRYNSRG